MSDRTLRLSVYFGDSLTVGARLASDVIMDTFIRHGLTVATQFRGVEGFGIGRRIHTVSFPDISTDLPLVATAVDRRERIERVVKEVDPLLNRGLLALEPVQLVTGQGLADPGLLEQCQGAAKLTIYCGRAERTGPRPAHRVIVDLLRRQGVAGATVLLGVDGLYHGARERARLFTRNDNVPLAIVTVAKADALRRVLPMVSGLLTDPVVTLEPVTLLKHDGELLEPLPAVATADGGTPDIWQTLELYTRQSAQFGGRALHTELALRLRRSGGAGVTTLLGERGFSSDESPFGDKIWTLASHVPSYTLYVDRPEKVAEVWPMIDEVTAEHGIVTSQFVPAYLERAGEIVHGRLDPAVETVSPGGECRQTVPFSAPANGAKPAPTNAAADGEAVRWLETLARQVTEFAEERGRRETIVRVTLSDGEQFFLASAEPRPGGGFVTLHPHPTAVADLMEGTPGGFVAPRAVVVPLVSITKIELLAKVPRGTRSLLAFKLPEPGASHLPS